MAFRAGDNEIAFLDDADKTKGYVRFPEVSEGVVDIGETYVAPSERGRGLAGHLMGRAVEHIRAEGKKVRLSCSYAREWFARHPEDEDLLA